MNRTLPLIFAAMTTMPACSDSSGQAAPKEGAPEGGGGPCALPRSLDEIVTVYGSAWNEPEADARLCALEASLTANATYIDPTIDTTTREGLSEAIGQFLSMAAGSSIVQTSGLDSRPGDLRFAWDFRTNGATVIKGYDYMETDESGRIVSIRGYWDPLPGPATDGPLAGYQSALAEMDAAARRAALQGITSDAVRYSGPDTAGVASGLDGVAEAMALPEGATATLVGTQVYPRFARTVFDVVTSAGTTRVTDYVHLGDGGKITRIGRFHGDFPEL